MFGVSDMVIKTSILASFLKISIFLLKWIPGLPGGKGVERLLNT